MNRPSHRPAGLVLTAAALLALASLIRCATGCTAAQGKRAEQILTKIGCVLVGVFSHDEQVATLCEDIAPEVEAEIAAAVADRDVKPDNLLGHRSRRRHRVRLAEHAPGRDPAETIEEGLPLEAALRVLRRREQVRPEVAAGPWVGGTAQPVISR